MDQVGPVSRAVEDAAITLGAMALQDSEVQMIFDDENPEVTVRAKYKNSERSTVVRVSTLAG